MNAFDGIHRKGISQSEDFEMVRGNTRENRPNLTVRQTDYREFSLF